MGKTSRGILGLALAAALLPWMAAPWWPTRDPWNDFKWPAVAFFLLISGALFASEIKHFPFKFALPNLHARSAFFIGAALIFIGLIASTAFSPAPAIGFRIFLREMMFLALAVFLAVRGVTPGDVHAILLPVMFSAIAQSALVIVQHWGVLSPGDATGRSAMVGTFGNPEYAAGWLAPIGAAAAVWIWKSSSKGITRLAAILTALGCAMAILLSGGRGAALSVVLAVWISVRECRQEDSVSPSGTSRSAFFQRNRVPVILGAGFVLLIVSGALIPGLSQSLPGRLAQMFNPYSVSVRHRMGLMTVNSRMIAADPLLGSGPGMYSVEFDNARGRLAASSTEIGPWVFNEIMSDQRASEAHCDPIQWWAEYGLLPFLGLLLILSGTLTQLHTDASAPSRHLESRLLLAAMLAMMIGMFFSFPLHRPSRALLFWVLVGLSNGLNPKQAE